MVINTRESYTKALKLLLLIVIMKILFSCKTDQVNSIITIDKQEIESLFPESYTFQHFENRPSGVISKNGKKFFYIANKFSTKLDIQNPYLSDTLNERVLRFISLDTVDENNFLLDFRLIDLKSDRIPEIFGNPRKKDIHYEIVSIKSIPNSTLNKNELLKIIEYLSKS